jgi:multidrug efflux pump subunit AcrB
LNNLPIKEMNGATIYIRDVANVRDGYTPQLNVVLANGIKGALLPVLKSGSASTLGGLTIALLFTLFFVPVLYKLLKWNFKPRALHPRLRSMLEEENHAIAQVS